MRSAEQGRLNLRGSTTLTEMFANLFVDIGIAPPTIDTAFSKEVPGI